MSEDNTIFTGQELDQYLKNNIKFNGWRFSAYQISNDRCQFDIELETEDNFNKGATTTIKHGTDITIPIHEQALVDFIWDRINYILKHEAGEQFYVSGKLPKNPHRTHGRIEEIERQLQA